MRCLGLVDVIEIGGGGEEDGDRDREGVGIGEERLRMGRGRTGSDEVCDHDKEICSSKVTLQEIKV